MSELWSLVSADEAHLRDKFAVKDLGISQDSLMECSGALLAREAEMMLSGDGDVVVFCGPGNNGGDGLVAARHLHNRGIAVKIVPVVEQSSCSELFLVNHKRVKVCGVKEAGLSVQPNAGSVWIDAIFGTGLKREVRGLFREAIEYINARRSVCNVLSVDLPSGLDSDTGRPLGLAIQADKTLALDLPKIGLALEPGRSLAGAVKVGFIGLPEKINGASPGCVVPTKLGIARRLPKRLRLSHKGSHGHVLIVAGSEGKTGAALLASMGATRSGCGLVTIACSKSLNDIFEAHSVEVMTVPVAETRGRSLSLDALGDLLELAGDRDVVAMGPGIGRESETLELVRRCAQDLDCPMVLDADALYAYAEDPRQLRDRSFGTVLTPHPGEAAALLGLTAAEVNADRLTAARRLAVMTNAVTVLKGSVTVIAQPDGLTVVNPSGGPALASGGTGDVLTGMIASFVGQGVSVFWAAVLGVYVHGLAADRLTLSLGNTGVLASEVAKELPGSLKYIRGSLRKSREAGDVVAFPEPR